MGLIRSKKTKLTPEDEDELTEYLWPIVREMIKTAIENIQNLTVEGCYIPLNWADDFSKEDAPDKSANQYLMFIKHRQRAIALAN